MHLNGGVEMNDEIMEAVSSFTHLGSFISEDTSWQSGLKTRVGKEMLTFRQLKMFCKLKMKSLHITEIFFITSSDILPEI